MARTKITTRKSTGPKGVPRHQLAPHNEPEPSSRPRRSRKELKAKIKQLKTERDLMKKDFTLARLDYYGLQQTVESLQGQIAQLTQQRDAIASDAQANTLRIYDLEHYVGDLEMYNIELHAEVHNLYRQLHPDPVPEQEDPEMGAVEDQEFGPVYVPGVDEDEDPDEEIEPYLPGDDDDVEVIVIDSDDE